MMLLEDFREALRDELGDAADLVRDEQLDRWVNRGRSRLGIFESTSATLTWDDEASSVALPSDFGRFDRLVDVAGANIPAYVVLAHTISFLDPRRVRAGSAVLYYGALFTEVSADSPSTMPALADEASVNYAIGRFFRRIAATRADFRRYVAVTGQSGVDVQDLLDLAADHDRRFEEARSELVAASPSSFYGD